MQTFTIEDRQFIFCPICHRNGLCKRHLVELWMGNQRQDPLQSVLTEEYDKNKLKRILRKYPTPESCFEDTILISWKLDPSSQPSLFEGANSEAYPETQTALFHQEGPKLLKRYQELVLSELNKGHHINRVLNVLGKKELKTEVPKKNHTSKKPAPSTPPITTPTTGYSAFASELKSSAQINLPLMVDSEILPPISTDPLFPKKRKTITKDDSAEISVIPVEQLVEDAIRNLI